MRLMAVDAGWVCSHAFDKMHDGDDEESDRESDDGSLFEIELMSPGGLILGPTGIPIAMTQDEWDSHMRESGFVGYPPSARAG